MRWLLLSSVVVLLACGSPSATRSASTQSSTGNSPAAAAAPVETIVQPTAATAVAATPAAATDSTEVLTCTASGPASSSFPPGPSQPQTGPPPIVSAAVTDDTFTLTFTQGTPQFIVTTQPNATFAQDGSGLPVTLPGSAGVRIVLRGFRGDRQNYTGPTPLSSNGPLLLQVREIGDFEGMVSWAAGLSSPGCASVTASGSTLTFRFIRTTGKG